MNVSRKKLGRISVLRDMAAVAAALDEAEGLPVSAEDLMHAMHNGSEGERRSRLVRFVCEGWINPEEGDNGPIGDWRLAHGRFVLGFVNLWRLELEEFEGGQS